MENIFEIYKLHVELIDRISSRRNSMNKYYTGLLSVLLSFIAIFNGMKYSDICGVTNILIGSIGIFICLIWTLNIQSYSKLSSAKFQVLEQIEDRLEFQFYKNEWNILMRTKKYKTLTSIEKYIPFLMSIPFLFLIIMGGVIYVQ